MKRSEAVKLIHNIISSELLTEEEFNLNDCSRLLKALEQAGMLPPPKAIEAVTESLAYCYYTKVSESKDIDGWYYFDRDNSQLWEPEDEEK